MLLLVIMYLLRGIMNQDDLIKNSRNIVWGNTISIGRNNPISLHTKNTSMYRVTGFAQVKDIIYSGYVKPKAGKINGGKHGVVYWSKGGDTLFFFDKRPVIEASLSCVAETDIGSLALDELEAIWIFDTSENSYQNRIGVVKEIREFLRDKDTFLSKDQIARILTNGVFSFEDKQEIIEMCRQSLNDNMGSLMDLKDEIQKEQSGSSRH